MNILVLNASPRVGGNISRMLEEISAEAEKTQGVKIEWIDVASLVINPCKGCMACRTGGDCLLPSDDAHRVLQLIEACDLLVVGVPTYWANMPGMLKILFDRIVYGMLTFTPRGLPVPRHRGKHAVILTTCTAPFPFNILLRQSRGTVSALRRILRPSGFKIVATVEVGGTHKSPVSEKTLRRCRKIITRLLARGKF